MSRLEDLAQSAVDQALKLGANGAECTLSEGEEFSAQIRLGEVESLKQAASRGVGVRVLLGQNTGSSYTSDLTPDGIRSMVAAAVRLASITTEDPHAGLPEPSELGACSADLELFDESIATLDPQWKIAQAKEAERVALSLDPRIQNSEGASFDSYLGTRVFASSAGFAGSYRISSCGLSVCPVAKVEGPEQKTSMERDYWHTSSRKLAKLEAAEEVGRRAAERTLRRLNPRKVATKKVAVILEPRTARSLLGDLFDAVNGGSIYRKASFLTGKLGEKVASELLTVVDDATMPGLFGSSPFDDEGVRSRRTVVLERGILKNYLLNTYAARKLNLKTTGNASRGITGNAGIGAGNFYLLPGSTPADAILAGTPSGLYITELIGTSANTVTGDYSSGASGFWIENGEVAYPVSEITIAGNLKDMLLGIEQVGSDLEFRASVASPTIKIQEMTVSGQ